MTLTKPKETSGIKIARSSFLHFVSAIAPHFIFSNFARDLCKHLQAFFVSSQKQEMPKLLLEAPPQHGKSLICAVLFPAWIIGVRPDLRIAVATYTFNLAKKRNIEIQRIMESVSYRTIFPEVRLRQGNKAVEGARDAEGFEVVGRDGSMRFVGVGGSLTGFPVDIGIIDDPYKDMSEARSQSMNNSVIEWYNAVFKTRLSKISGTVMMLTRWATNDLAAWCMQNEKWIEHKYRAIDNDKALVPALHPLTQLMEIRDSMPDSIWEAMYQQNPVIQGGNIIREEWLRYYHQYPQKFEKLFLVGDTAQKTKEHNDYSVLSVFGESENMLYMLDMWRAKVTAPSLRDAAIIIWNKWREGINNTLPTGFYIEDKASGTGLIQELLIQSAIPIVPLQRDKDKYTRLMDVLNYIQAGRLYVPANAPWTITVVNEMMAFSGDMKHEHDDIVDTIVDGLTIAFGPGHISSLDVL